MGRGSVLGSGEVGLVVRLDGGGVRVELGLRFEVEVGEGAMEKGEEGELGERGFCVEVVVSAGAGDVGSVELGGFCNCTRDHLFQG